VQSFLRELREQSRRPVSEKIFMVWDNHRAHDNPATRAACEELGIEPLFMPAYSPELNSIETLWAVVKRRLKSQLAQNVQRRRFKILAPQFLEFVKEALKVEPQTVKAIINANRQTLSDVLSSALNHRRN